MTSFGAGVYALVSSKTFWVNLLALILAVIPPITEWITSNGFEAAGLLIALNLLAKSLTALLAALEQYGENILTPESYRFPGIEEKRETPVDTATCVSNSDCVGGSSSNDSHYTDVLPILILGICLSLMLVSCGHSVSYDPDSGLSVSRSGYVITVNQSSPK